MTAAYRSWFGPARTMALAVDAAVSAARAQDASGFDEAIAALSTLDRDQLGMLLGAATRDLIERAHPDGLDSDDAEELLRSCIRFSVAWYPHLDTAGLIRALTGALSVGEAEEGVAIDGLAVLAHGLLLITDRLTAADLELSPVLDAALAELMRAQTVELP